MSDSTIGQKSKAKHLTYLGCTTVEQEVNIGAGTITCNYDGFGKHKTLFKRKSFIGSNSTFVAPITVGEGAITASGSVFTKDIPDKALGIARSHHAHNSRHGFLHQSDGADVCQLGRLHRGVLLHLVEGGGDGYNGSGFGIVSHLFREIPEEHPENLGGALLRCQLAI